MKINSYHRKLTKKDIEAQTHRDMVGGMWDEIGKFQFEFIKKEGLQRDMLFLDIGCGCLRGGIHFIDYLNNNNYYGIDINQSLLDAGYDKELAEAGLQSKIPKANLLCDEHFTIARFGRMFDFALAQSVFTHLPLNHIRLCLIQLAPNMKTGGKFYTTYFECPSERAIEQQLTHQPGGITTYTDQDPYHYKVSDFSWCIVGLPWQMHYIGAWGHPRAQNMLCFKKI
jgi:SAM-dependent methyltransferase